MAQHVNVTLIDDIDGSAGAETVVLHLDQRYYEIDLSDHHAGELRSALAPYMEKGRTLDKAPSGRRPPQRKSTKGSATKNSSEKGTSA